MLRISLLLLALFSPGNATVSISDGSPMRPDYVPIGHQHHLTGGTQLIDTDGTPLTGELLALQGEAFVGRTHHKPDVYGLQFPTYLATHNEAELSFFFVSPERGMLPLTPIQREDSYTIDLHVIPDSALPTWVPAACDPGPLDSLMTTYTPGLCLAQSFQDAARSPRALVATPIAYQLDNVSPHFTAKLLFPPRENVRQRTLSRLLRLETVCPRSEEAWAALVFAEDGLDAPAVALEVERFSKDGDLQGEIAIMERMLTDAFGAPSVRVETDEDDLLISSTQNNPRHTVHNTIWLTAEYAAELRYSGPPNEPPNRLRLFVGLRDAVLTPSL